MDRLADVAIQVLTEQAAHEVVVCLQQWSCAARVVRFGASLVVLGYRVEVAS